MKTEPLHSCMHLGPSEVIAVVGAGGKTSLIHHLARYLNGKRLISPSTKMFLPKEPWPCHIHKPYEWQDNQPVMVAADRLSEGKIIGLNPHSKSDGQDYWLIEADGSRGLPLKGWGPEEPVIPTFTTITLGVVSINALGLPIDETTVFRLETFRKLVGTGETVTLTHLTDMILHRDGLFRNSVGRRILLINQVESPVSLARAMALRDEVTTQDTQAVIDRIVIGSAMNGIGYNEV